MYELINQFLNGLSLGAIYALIAVGYTMVYGIIKLINFAHGEFMMAGAFLGYFTLRLLGGRQVDPVVSFIIALGIAGTGAGALAALVDLAAYRPIRRAGRIAALLTAIGASLFLQNLGIELFQAAPRGFAGTFVKRQYPPPTRVSLLEDGRRPDPEAAPVTLPPDRRLTPGLREELRARGVETVYLTPKVTIDSYQIIVLAVLAVSGLGLHLLVNRTQMGRAMRAVSYDPTAAALMGVNVNRVISVTFFVGAFLAGASGVLFGMTYNSIDPQMGMMPGLKAFVAAVLGGIGRIPGAIVGGFLMGVTEALVVGYVSSSYRDAIAFGVLILVLLVRPQGLLGRTEEEKV